MIALLWLTLMACEETPAPVAARPPSLLSPDAFPAPAASAPSASSTSAAPAAGGIEGAVAEQLAAPPYTYNRVVTDAGESIWAASAGAPPAMGSRVRVPTGLPMRDFHSDSLKRDFPLVYFVEAFGAVDGAAPPVAAAPATPSTAAAPKVTTTAPAGDAIAVEKVWADRAKLAGQTVTVRGTVVRYTAHVMGKNWLHIQDGTGAAGSNDLTITTQGETSKGATVQVTGLVMVDQDFGAGYAYPVLISDAALAVVKP